MIISAIKNFEPTTSSVREGTNNTSQPKPFVQWVGGKRQVLDKLLERVPPNFRAYHEPFVGGGALYFELQNSEALIADNNAELILTYNVIKDDVEELIKILKLLKNKHSKGLYYEIRSYDRDPKIWSKLRPVDIAARLIYLNQTCFNALYRVNRENQFNVPIGSNLNRLICDEETLRADHHLLKNTQISCDDFEQSLKKVKKNDFAYLDPPYHPIGGYADFTRYTKEKFFEEDQKRLFETFDRLHQKGTFVLLSNSNTPFIRKLFKGFNIGKVTANRTLNCKTSGRGKVEELLISNY